MDRAVATMRLFHVLSHSEQVQTIVPVATSAVREATNQAEFIARIAAEAGLSMRVLTAREEAYYGYLGVVNSIDLRDGFTIDIGGGSTQVSQVRGRGFLRWYSQPIGALRAAERFVRSDPISNKDFRALESGIIEYFASLDWLSAEQGPTLVGIGGTIRTLAEIDQKVHNYPLDRVHGYVLLRERLEALIEQLRGMDQRQREEIPGLRRDRADLILPGAVILAHLMRRGGFEALTVGGQGLREGIFYEHFLVGEQPPLFADMRGFSVQNLARIYNYEALHAAKVRDLAFSMFDQLRPCTPMATGNARCSAMRPHFTTSGWRSITTTTTNMARIWY